jgi:hypothetical protein
VSRAAAAGGALAACVALACFAPSVASADAVSSAQLRSLAQEAATDPGALARLRAVDRVDGHPVDLAAALRGASGSALRQRLSVLAAAPAAAAGGDPRADARDILSQRRFTGTGVPGPFRGLLDWLGTGVRKLLDAIDGLVPGPRGIAWLAIALVIVALAAIGARRTLTRRVRAATAAAAAAAPPRDTARDLERQAEAAEAAGDLAAALRLRFRAGLLRLDERGAIEFRPSISTYEVRRTLRSTDFDALAGDFDEVIYGGRPAALEDVLASRRRWPAVLEQAPRDKVAA